MQNSEQPYKDYQNTPIWKIVKEAVQELSQNQDIQEKTPRDYIVGYITKKLLDQDSKL